MTTWSPGERSKKNVDSAAMPEAKQSAPNPSSSAAIASCRAVLVGFPVRA